MPSVAALVQASAISQPTKRPECRRTRGHSVRRLPMGALLVGSDISLRRVAVGEPAAPAAPCGRRMRRIGDFSRFVQPAPVCAAYAIFCMLERLIPADC